ncbi:E3 ubiquitin-protein ligase TRIM39-like isoform X2 [Gouania willdenowi]|uniref:E3 ubiquitin-protein ligase TRIM39-like n=1 Tax=Gouania willdenowi TaxID=441366 RepID=A0A8C5DLH8_GOUWI|nr:E3 ubiquitin-protein ligase TRIM39-like isoform X2 [Gouania willdenowi]
MMAFEAQVRCCICLDIYVDPVSIPCGHNFCLDCIEGYWDSKDKPKCPLCQHTFSSRPKLKVNTEFATIVDFFKKSMQAEPTAIPTEQEEADKALCDVCRGKKHAKPCSACQAKNEEGNVCKIHHRPLTLFCRKDQMLMCTQCSEEKHKHHNTILLDNEKRRLKSRLRETKTNIQEMIEVRETKMEEIQHSVEVSKTNTEKEVQKYAQICSVLIQAIQRQQTSLVQDLETKQREAETRSQQLLAQLQEEINQLQAKDAELQLLETNLSSTNILQLHQLLSELPPSREWSDVPVHSDQSLGTVRKAFSKLVEVCQELVNRLSAEDTAKMSQHAVNITLDPQTASGWLLVSSDGKKVGDKSDWDLGVASESINRKGTITVRPDKGFWAICRRKGGNLSACVSPYVNIDLQESPRKVGVFLDYELGSVSFFNSETKTHIYTYDGFTFTEPLYPYFNPCVQDNGKNVAPLVICSLDINAEQSVTIETGVQTLI